MKTTSEAKVGEALRRAGAFVYKPPDDARNRKPCDFFAWRVPPESTAYEVAHSYWIEVKLTDNLVSMPWSEIRPAQRAGIAEAMRLGIPYHVVIWWRRLGGWTSHLMTDPLKAELYRNGFFFVDAKDTPYDLMDRVFDD